MTALERILADRVVALLRAVPNAAGVAASLVEGGVRILEVTMDSPDAEELIRELGASDELTLLAGTVRTPAEAERAVAAGAEGCVSPVFSADVVARCRELGVPAIPGALTPTEIETATGAGAALVKLFPAGALGPAYVRDVLAPLRGVPLLASGGIDAVNAGEFLRAGAAAVAAGSSLTGSPDPAEAARRLVAAVRSA